MKLETHSFLLTLALSCALASAAPATRPEELSIDRAVAQLADPDPHVRQRASRSLWSAGKAAEPALMEAARGNDPEIAARAREILTDFRHGIHPDTPADIVELIRTYRRGTRQEKHAVVGSLITRGTIAYPFLVRLSLSERDPALRAELFRTLTRRLHESVPACLVENEWATAEQLLELGMADRSDGRDYAVYTVLRGQANAKIQELLKRPDLDAAPGAEMAVAHLYQAGGDLANARKWAARTRDDELIETVAYQQADWKTLANMHRDAAADDVEALGFLAAYQRLSGDKAGFEKTLQSLLKILDGPADEVWFVAEALLLNDRVNDAIELLIRKNRPVQAFELLAAQHRFREAFALSNKAIADKHATARRLRAMTGRSLQYLGETDRASTMFNDLAAELAQGGDLAGWGQLIEAEMACRRMDQALAHCAVAMPAAKASADLATLLERIFPEQGAEAAIWHEALARQHPDQTPAQILDRIRPVLGGKLGADELAALAADAAKLAESIEPPEREARLRTIAARLLAGGCDEAGVRMLRQLSERTQSPEDFIRLGDWAAARKDWTTAASWYSRAVEKDRTRAESRYLLGHALVQSGREAEGRRMMELAALLPLASESRRWQLIQTMQRLGHRDEVLRQEQLLVRTGRISAWETNNALRSLGYAAAARKDYMGAATSWEQSCLDCLRTNTSFIETTSYLTLPHMVHRTRARGLASAGRLDEAMKEADLALATVPGDITLAIELAPVLRKAGHAAAAEELTNRLLAEHETILADYPRSAQLHNAAAWLLARCHTQLDKALEHAARGVELEPGNVAIIDTLAEVYFQRGQNAKAIEAIEKCMKLEPANARHRLCLERFRNGAADTEPPAE